MLEVGGDGDRVVESIHRSSQLSAAAAGGNDNGVAVDDDDDDAEAETGEVDCSEAVGEGWTTRSPARPSRAPFEPLPVTSPRP